MRAWSRRWVGGLAVVLVCWASRIGAAPGGAAPIPAAGQPPHLVEIDVRGAAALVTVTRTLAGSRRAGDAREEILDLALPPDAHLLDVDVDVQGDARFDSVQPSPAEGAHDGYLEATRALGLTPRALSFDDETTTRVRVALRQQKPTRAHRSATVSRLWFIWPAGAPSSPSPRPPTRRARPRA